MNCIIVDDEPLAREGMLLQLQDMTDITVTGSFNSVKKARAFMAENTVDLIFLDIQMPGITGLEFAATIPSETLVIFTTAYSQYALESYEVEAIDYIVKPVKKDRLVKAVQKAEGYKKLLSGQNASMESMDAEFMLIKSERRYHKIMFSDILYIEGLKDYVVIYAGDNKIITAMNLKTIHGHLNVAMFSRVSKSYLVNINHIDSFDNHTIYIKSTEIPIGDVFRAAFLELYLGKDLSGKL
jgi:DNA-binding LytR/AlgR family response regulator